MIVVNWPRRLPAVRGHHPGELGAAISERGRETIAPLIGDLQIRRVIDREPPLDETAITRRAGQAYERFFRLNSASGKP